jgi:hypothetical protein
MNNENRQWVDLHFGSDYKYGVNDNSVKTARAIEAKLDLIVYPSIYIDSYNRFMRDLSKEKFYLNYGLTSAMIQSKWIELELKTKGDRLTICVKESDGQMRFEF